MDWNFGLIFLLLGFCFDLQNVFGCQFFPPGEYLRFVRVPENFRVGEEILIIDVFPRNKLTLKSIDKDGDADFFTYRDLNRTTVSLLLARSLDDLVDRDNPRNVLKFKILCDYNTNNDDVVSSSLAVTVYVEDVNDHSPVFEKAPYQLTIEELTPVGLTIFRGIHATDRDKSNTPNSDVQYSITGGNEKGKFGLDAHEAFLILKKQLDFDNGDRDFVLTITASDRGIPQLSSNATIKIVVQDSDDLPPKFTKGVYRTKISENYPLTGEKLHSRLQFTPPIFAFDQDVGIDTPIRYDILAGNERHLFYLDHVNGSLFLDREIDLDAERSLPGNTFVLQIQASQIDNPLKTGVARVEVEILDINDNLPEFEVDVYNISIVENLPNGFSVLQIIANDQDQGDNGEFTYQLDDKTKAFTLDSRSGWLTVRDQTVLDREKRSVIKMRVFAKEKVPSVIPNSSSPSSVLVEITLLDANDNNPTFIPNNIYEFNVTNDAKIGDNVGQIHAIDPDLGRNGMVIYSIQKGTTSGGNHSLIPFKIDSKTGRLTINGNLFVGRHLVFVEAADQPINLSEKRVSLAVVTIDVISKINFDGIPEFIGAPYEFWVGSNVGIGTSVGQIRMNDDGDTRKSKLYDLSHSYHEGVPFAIEERSGTIAVVKEILNFDRILYEFEAIVLDENNNHTSTTDVTIHVVDFDDDIFLKTTASTPIEFHIKENQPKKIIGTILKNSTLKDLKFTIANQRDFKDKISIASNGTLFSLKPLDREETSVYRLTIIGEYTKKGNSIKTGVFQVNIFIDDLNDNPPKFERDFYEGRIKENSISGTEVELNRLIHVKDIDQDENGEFTVRLTGNGSEMFRFDKNSGRIFFNSGFNILDREEIDVYHLKVLAEDKGGLKNEVDLNIFIDDVNDNAPEFDLIYIGLNKGVQIIEYDKNGAKVINLENNMEKIDGIFPLIFNKIKNKKEKTSPILSLPEDTPIGSIILKLIAHDKDFGENALIKYELISETYIPKYDNINFHFNQFFMVNPSNGEVLISRNLPAESEFRLNISATDKNDLKDHVVVRIFIKDVNDHQPVFKKSSYSFDVEETNISGKILGKIEAIDGDFGQNSNISYTLIDLKNNYLPFKISKYEGILKVNDSLDREKQDKYSFYVQAKDNPQNGKFLSTLVNVVVNVLDINDNKPIFYGYDDLKSTTPIYLTTISENTPIGTPITKVFANDSDFTGNGNGLILFDIPYSTKNSNLFTIDSKEGIVTTIGKLNYDQNHRHNLSIIASDLGSPSLSSTALLSINILKSEIKKTNETIQKPIFDHRYYEVEVEENVPVPLKLLTLNVTEHYKNYRLRFTIVDDNTNKRIFKIDPRNGSLYIIESPDREKIDRYVLKIKLDQYKIGRDMTVMVYPVTNEKLNDIGFNEVKVVVRVTDLNDNAPRFTITGRPIVAAIPASANYGYQTLKLQAKDPDLGINGEIRYQIIGRADEATKRFSIDPVSGQVRAISNFVKDAGKVYGFDVKATDKKGADDGKSSIANVFVYVLDEQKQLIMIMGSEPAKVENGMENITLALYNTTGFDIRVRKLEPHSDRKQIDATATDMYLYAVDPLLNVIVDTDVLQKVLQQKQEEIESNLNQYKLLGLSSGSPEHSLNKSQKILLTSMEIGIIILACLVFVGALGTAIGILCLRRRKRRSLQKRYGQQLGYTFTSTLGKPTLFPSTYDGTGIHYGESVASGPIHQRGTSAIGYRHHHHDVTCPRYLINNKRVLRGENHRNSLAGLETSITSLHSSGHDSGIVDNVAVLCQCGGGQSSNGQTSEEDSSNYEDSLKSIPMKKRDDRKRESENRGFSEEYLHRPSFVHKRAGNNNTSLMIAGGRRSSERLMIA
ncbi:cadherin-89D isoform X2 [Onthophagus taurus]|uniref:cadherin-89D isoform X2 n=1 Tax=Onthophagus taurus TaxID=166361 RepID=UPI000C207E8D|nr:cadherin-89D isoform X2 [Onthophagus taurus]